MKYPEHERKGCTTQKICLRFKNKSLYISIFLNVALITGSIPN